MATFDPSKYEPLTWRDRAYNRFQQFSFWVYTSILLVLFLIVVLWPRIFIVIPPGHHAVKYEPLGSGTLTDPAMIHGEGLHIIFPWDTLFVYETRLQQQELEFSMLSDEGLDLPVVVSVRFRAERDMLGFLHQDIGTDYYDRLVRPQVEAHVRETLGRRPAHEIYSSAGDLIQVLSHVTTLTRIGDAENPYVTVQELELVDVDLPSIVEQAIADRYQQEQLRLEYDDRLVREEKEAERKRIEAKGIFDFSEIVGEQALRWRDIEAIKELALSPNAKLIMLGSQGSGTQPPLVFSLGTDVVPTPAEPPAQPAQPAQPESAP